MQNEYEIHIGETHHLDGSKTAKYTLVITEGQLDVIKTFAHTKKDKDLNTIYILNDSEFKVYPKLKTCNHTKY